MLEETFEKTLNELGYEVDLDGKELRVLKIGKVVAKVDVFEPFKMHTLDCPNQLIDIIVDFSSTKYENRF